MKKITLIGISAFAAGLLSYNLILSITHLDFDKINFFKSKSISVNEVKSSDVTTDDVDPSQPDLPRTYKTISPERYEVLKKEHINKAFNGETYNDIFLDFRLGMSQKEYDDLYAAYKDSGLFKNNEIIDYVPENIVFGKVNYKKVQSNPPYDTYKLLDDFYKIEPGFYKDQLYVLKLTQVGFSGAFNTEDTIKNILLDKYSGDAYDVNRLSISSIVYNVIVKGNREIKITHDDIIYRDIFISEQKINIEKEKEQKISNIQNSKAFNEL